MTDNAGGMGAERFAALAQAYGGQLDRWPAGERGAAAVFAQSAEGRAILAQAARLDSMLDAYIVQAPGSAVFARVLGGTNRRLSRHRRLRLWLSGFGLLGGCLAGAIAGFIAIAVLAPGQIPDEFSFGAHTTAFGDVEAEAETLEEGP